MLSSEIASKLVKECNKRSGKRSSYQQIANELNAICGNDLFKKEYISSLRRNAASLNEERAEIIAKYIDVDINALLDNDKLNLKNMSNIRLGAVFFAKHYLKNENPNLPINRE